MTTLRFRFAKYGAMRYLGHLDLLRYFQKAVRRADIPVAYSGGFSPHQIMSFAMPLSVGLTSEGEYFDIGLEEPGGPSTSAPDETPSLSGQAEETGNSSLSGASPVTSAAPLLTAEEYRAALQEAMVDGIDILSAGFLPEGGKKAMAEVAAAGYIIYYKGLLPDKSPEEISSFFQTAEKIPVTKKTKRGERELDLKQLVYRFESGTFSEAFFAEHPFLERNPDFHMAPGEPYFYTLVNASSGDNVRPEFLMQALTGVDFEADGFLNLGVHRTDLYSGSKEEGFQSLSNCLNYS